MANESLSNAAKVKNDEFYTQLSDIERELKHYKKHFKGKTILCNCDDPYESNFFKYFALNFNVLGLKRLICTCYDNSPIIGEQLSLFDVDGLKINKKQNKKAYKIIINKVEDENGDGAIDLLDIKQLIKTKGNVLKLLKGDGDFRSDECIEILKEADIVVTNPPFSLFKEYVKQLIDYNIRFLILGNQNAVTYKEIFPLLKNNKMWLGFKCGDMSFMVPDYYEPKATRYWQDENGQKWRSLGNICWYTNLDISKRHEDLVLYKKYSEEEYPKFDNYDAINVDKVVNIPKDYKGAMGVPITFLDKYNPEQFEIIGLAPEREKNSILRIKKYEDAIQYNDPTSKQVIEKKKKEKEPGNKVNDGPTILHDKKPSKYPFYTSKTVKGKFIEVLFARILIKRKD